MAKVVLEHVNKTYPGGVAAVRDACLTIEDREFVVLVGPSGCGKSTTLRLIAGLEETSAGEIFIDGRRVTDVPPRDRDVAMVFQNYALYPHMSVFENMAFGLRLRGCPRDETERRVRAAAEVLGIADLLGRRPKALSGGQRQRVAVGRAIVRQPKAFLFDEPLSNLDAKMRVQMRAEIRRLHRRLQATMIYVTHDQVEAMTMGDRIVVMKDGVIHQAAPPMEIYDRPANRFVAGFIGSPPMNFLEGRLTTDAAGLAFDAGTFALRVAAAHRTALAHAAGRPIVLGIRPEDLHAHGTGDGDGAVFRATLEVTEPMGAETLWHLRSDAHAMVARAGPRAGAAEGSEVAIRAAMDRARYFDAESGRAVV